MDWMSENEDNGFTSCISSLRDQLMESVRTTIVRYLHKDRTMTQP